MITQPSTHRSTRLPFPHQSHPVRKQVERHSTLIPFDVDKVTTLYLDDDTKQVEPVPQRGWLIVPFVSLYVVNFSLLLFHSFEKSRSLRLRKWLLVSSATSFTSPILHTIDTFIWRSRASYPNTVETRYPASRCRSTPIDSLSPNRNQRSVSAWVSHLLIPNQWRSSTMNPCLPPFRPPPPLLLQLPQRMGSMTSLSLLLIPRSTPVRTPSPLSSPVQTLATRSSTTKIPPRNLSTTISRSHQLLMWSPTPLRHLRGHMSTVIVHSRRKLHPTVRVS